MINFLHPKRMKFIIERKSDKNYQGKPCKIAFKVGKNKLSNKDIFAVEFATLNEFLKFKRSMGQPLVIYHSNYYPDIDIKEKIVIHDRGYID